MKSSQTATPGLVRPPVQLGDMLIHFLDGGRLKLDGGAMFGIIPKTLWQGLISPDEANRVSLGTTCLVVETEGRRILIETGMGDKYDDKERDIFDLSDFWLLDSLTAARLDPDSIDFVILTHLHFDHAGGATCVRPDGSVQPTFPRARYVVQRGEWDDARTGYCVMANTYREENLAPLEASGCLALVDAEAEIAPGVSVRPLPGHTRHQQGVVIRGGGRTLLHLADMMPTAAHVGLRYNMAYDLQPYDNMRTKERVLDESLSGNWLLVIGQDAGWPLWRPVRDAKRVSLERA
jgi:glyoxylase-like metal-dependent hydrolase (beta-lactamase superfamily II)